MAEGGDDNGPAAVKQEAVPINIVVRDQGGTEVHFKIKTTTKFEKVLKAYCDKKSVALDAVRFLFEGERVMPEDTPATLNMEDNDVLDVVIAQIGGGRRC